MKNKTFYHYLIIAGYVKKGVVSCVARKGEMNNMQDIECLLNVGKKLNYLRAVKNK